VNNFIIFPQFFNNSSKGFSRLKEALIAGDSESDVGTEAYLVRKIK
jgi:hypothetical protein